MNRTRYGIVLFFALLIMTMSVSQSCFAREEAYSRTVEVRAVWMDRGSIPATEEAMRELVRGYARAGINVLHPEVIYNGYSAYPSDYLTQRDYWDGLDMLGIIIDEAHKHQIEVHPWVWIFRTGHIDDMGGILTRYPAWAAVGRDGEVLANGTSYWLCPSIPGVRRLILSSILELVERYPVDGIELDYIRYHNSEYCYNQSCRQGFQAEHGIDPLHIEPFTQPVIDWRLWRENLVNSFVAEVAAEVRNFRPNLKISAAVATLPGQARMNHLQDWEHWAANRWVDFLAPMDYTADSNYFRRVVVRSDDAIDDRVLLAPGIGLHLQQTVDPMLTQIDISRDIPVNGVTFFATAYIDESHLSSLGEGPFRESSLIPFRMPVAGARRLMLSAREKLADSPSPDALRQAELEIQSAKSLVRYAAYRLGDAEYIPPSAPPIYIPETIIPVPEAGMPVLTSIPAIDGALDGDILRQTTRLSIEYTNLGDRAPQPTDVYVARDEENLYVAYRCYEPELGRLRAEVTEHDGPVFTDDSVELFLSIDPDSDEYFHFVVNSIGTRYEARGFDRSFNPEWQVATGREQDAWTVEMRIPLESLGWSPDDDIDTWRANFCRNRMVRIQAGEEQNMSWSPTYGSYHTPIRFGRLTISE